MPQKIITIFDKLRALAAHRYFRMFILALFLVQALFLVVFMHIGTPPDETNHIEFIEYYAEHSLSPVLKNQTPTWSLGDKTREIDYLYHYSQSLLARIIPGEKLDVYIIRLTTVITALATFLALIRLLKYVKVTDGAINVSLLILTNLPMVLMLSAAVNNDVAVWLGTVLGMLFVLKIWNAPKPFDVLILLCLAVYGGLIKRTLFPVMLALVVIAFVIVIKKWRIFKNNCKHIRWDWRMIIATLVLILGTGLLAERAGGNILQYHSLTPTCEQVQGDKPCAVFWQNARQTWVDAGAPPSGNIWLPAGSTTEAQLMPLPFFIMKWVGVSAYNTIDIQTQGWGHKVQPAVWLVAGMFIVLAVAILYGLWYDTRRIRESRVSRQRLSVLFIAGVIVLAQLLANLASYHSTHVFGLALNGRYILPALVLLVGLAAFYYTKLVSQRANVILACIMIVCVVAGTGLVLMVRNPQLFTG